MSQIQGLHLAKAGPVQVKRIPNGPILKAKNMLRNRNRKADNSGKNGNAQFFFSFVLTQI